MSPGARQPSLGRGARERILVAARELFRDPGVNASGISEIVDRARVSRRTLYQHFASKDELVVAWLRELAGDPTLAPQRVLRDAGLTPRARLLEVFATLGEGPRPLRGDPFLAAAVELSAPDHPARAVIRSRQRGLATELGGVARAAGARDAERVGERLAVLYAGASAASVALDDGAPIAHAAVLAGRLLADAID